MGSSTSVEPPPGGGGTGATGTDETYNERYLHWLLSEPDRVQEAFTPVWRACSSTDVGPAAKEAVLEVMLRVVEEFEGSADAETEPATPDRQTMAFGDGAEEAVGRTARQLVRNVNMLPEKLTKAEALYLFRTALLSVQAALVMKNGLRGPAERSGGDGSPLDSDGFARSPTRTPFQSPSLAMIEQRMGPSLPAGSLAAEGLFFSPSPSPMMRATSRAEDTSPGKQFRPFAGRHLHPALATLPPSVATQIFQGGGMLPSRKELEAESEQVRRLTEMVEATARSELAVVRQLELEVEARREADGDGASTVSGTAASQSDAEALRKLESTSRSQQRQLQSREADVAAQRREIQVLLASRSEEEAEADEFSRESRDLTLELRSCRRMCGSLESEIASEEARACALREAFEGRRARFATAETAARNAELSTMRATRRRIAAEVAARREAEAVEDAMRARSEASTSTAVKMEAVASQIAELRSRSALSQEKVSTALRGSVNLKSLHNEMAEAEREQEAEVAAAELSGIEVAELEVTQVRLEGQLATRESELHAMHRRALRAESGSKISSASDHRRTLTPLGILYADSEDANPQLASDLKAAEARVAAGRERERALKLELKEMLVTRAPVSPLSWATDTSEEPSGSSAWRRARELGSELGEAHAALARRKASEHQAPGQDAVSVLRLTLQDAQSREARSQADLAQLRSQAAQALAEQRALRQKVALLAVTPAAEEVKAPEPEVSQGYLSSLMPTWLMASSPTAAAGS